MTTAKKEIGSEIQISHLCELEKNAWNSKFAYHDTVRRSRTNSPGRPVRNTFVTYLLSILVLTYLLLRWHKRAIAIHWEKYAGTIVCPVSVTSEISSNQRSGIPQFQI
jgi:hypothetical protein